MRHQFVLDRNRIELLDELASPEAESQPVVREAIGYTRTRGYLDKIESIQNSSK